MGSPQHTVRVGAAAATVPLSLRIAEDTSASCGRRRRLDERQLPYLLVVPGAMAAGLTDSLFWWSLALALAVACGATGTVTMAMIARGSGHALVHAHPAH